MADVPLSEQIRAVERELGLRKAVYPRQVSVGRMAADNAHRELAAMQAVLTTLQGLAGAPAQPDMLSGPA